MSHELFVRASAQRDIAEACAYYADHGRDVAFLDALDNTFQQIADRPLMYPVVYEQVRRALLQRFQYSVFFILDPAPPGVERPLATILAVKHQRRDPAARPRP